MINLFLGPVVNPKTLTHFDALPRCFIAVGSDGNIISIENDADPSAVQAFIAQRGLKGDEYTFVDLSTKSCEFIMPGMIDTHVHACQFPIMGVGGDDELLAWLNNTVFPTEKLFRDEEYAKSAYEDVIRRSIASGTTTSCYYGSRHCNATIALADIVHGKGQRAFVGKCSMDWDCPGDYIDESADISVEETIALINHIQSLPPSHCHERLVHPIITPRFALSCSHELLTKLGELAASMPGIAIQTHICENRKEVAEAHKRFRTDSYAEIYDRFGLLRYNTILGHGVWLSEKDMALIAKRRAAVAHCPASNFFLGSGMAKVGRLLDYGIKVGLGTDVSGGNNPSVLYAIQMASTASKMVAVQAELDGERCRHGKYWRGEHGERDGYHHRDARTHSDPPPDLDSDGEAKGADNHKHHPQGENDVHHGPREHHIHHANGNNLAHAHAHDHRIHAHDHHTYHPCPPRQFVNQKLKLDTLAYLATLGGAHVCGLQDRVGSFAVGKAFDALYVSLDDATAGNPAVWGRGVDAREREPNEGNIRRWLERFFFGGDNRNVRRVFVQGDVIGGADVPAGTGAKV